MGLISIAIPGSGIDFKDHELQATCFPCFTMTFKIPRIGGRAMLRLNPKKVSWEVLTSIKTQEKE
jgi:hypothetical protein